MYTLPGVASTKLYWGGVMGDLRRVGLDEVVVHFQELEDPRSTINQRHPLASVLVIALLAVLAGAGGPTAIAGWAALKEEFLLGVLHLPHGIPRKDVFRRVLMALKPAAFQTCFATGSVALCRGGRSRRGIAGTGGGRQTDASHDRSHGLAHCTV